MNDDQLAELAKALEYIAGLLLFGFVFAVNSSVHSQLILAFGSAERITRDVGFYDMANAAGRLIDTLLSAGRAGVVSERCGMMALASWWAPRRLGDI
ncbi:hypothetical protein [Paracoccus amoyensis]|uniref:hypothetical protein n=1 Tax=Paracoccus amoyensis TaxID=2760093 RepID=UPI003CCD18CD